MKINISGKHKFDCVNSKKISTGVYYAQIIFDSPKRFDYVTGDYSITIIKPNPIEITFVPETKDEENLRFFCDGSRYILDVIAIDKNHLIL